MQWKIGQEKSWSSQFETTCRKQETKQKEKKEMTMRDPATGRFMKACKTQKKACACKCAKDTKKKTAVKKAAPKAKKTAKKAVKKTAKKA